MPYPASSSSTATPTSPRFSLQAEFFAPDVLRIDVSAKNLPQNFLGTAFDLAVPGKWSFDHEELCGIFSRYDPDVFHLASAQYTTGRIVFGLTVPGSVQTPRFDHGIRLPDGCLASFYFRAGSFRQGPVVFEHTTLSIYKNGRHDLTNVIWEPMFLQIPRDSTEQSFPSQSAGMQAGVTQEYIGQNPGTLSQQGFPNSQADFLLAVDPSLVGVYIFLLSVIALGLGIFAAIVVYFRIKPKD